MLRSQASQNRQDFEMVGRTLQGGRHGVNPNNGGKYLSMFRIQ